MTTGVPRLRRERLIDACAGHQTVLLAAPYGTGKSVLAGQLADEHPGARAYVTSLRNADELIDRIVDSWGLSGSAGSNGLAMACASLGGPGIIVIDGFGSPRAATVLGELVPALPPDVRLVVCTRDADELTAIDVVKLGADGRLVLLGLDDLRFDPDELDRLGSNCDGGTARARHGGWPIAAAAATGSRPPDDAALCHAALSAAPERVRAIVSLLAPCGAVADEIVHAVAGTGVDTLAEWTWRLSPAVAHVEDGVVHFTEAAATTTASSPVPLDVGAVDAAASRLDGARATASVEALLVLQRWDAAAGLLDRCARSMLADGHGTALARWVRRIPDENRTLALVFAAAFAGLNSGETGIADLEALHDRIWAEEPDLGPWAAATVLWAMLGLGDPRFLPFCSSSLTRVFDGFPRLQDLERRVADLPRSARSDALHLVMAAVQLLLLTRHPDAREQARALIDAVEQSLLRLGRSAEAARALFVVGEVFTGARVPGDPALSVLPSIDSAPRTTGMWCLLRLMFTAVRFGDVALLEALVERLDAWLEEVPDLCAGDVSPPAMTLAAMRYFVATLSGEDGADGDVDALWHAHLAHHTNSARVSAILIAVCRLDAGDVAGARFWHGRAVERRDNRFLLLKELTVLGNRLELRESGSASALAALDANLDANRAGGHHGTVAMLQRWAVLDLAAIGAREEALERMATAVAAGELPDDLAAGLRARISGDTAPAPERPVKVRSDTTPTLLLLGPEVVFEDGAGGGRSVRGRQAMLLALLATREGMVEVDRAVDILFGDTEVDTGRQRLYTTVYRTRKQLGLGPEALRVEDGVVRLDGAGLRVDVWDFEAGADSAVEDVALAALGLYGGDLCSRQFAYEDFVEEARRALRARFVRCAVRVLDARLDGGVVDDPLADLGRRAWAICPDDEALCASTVKVLARRGHRREAVELVRATTDHLTALGIPCGLDRVVADEIGVALP